MTGVIDKIAWIQLGDGRILSTRSRGKDVYYLPGGKREPGETDLDTLVREVEEELAVTIDPGTARQLGTFRAQAHGNAEGITVQMTCYTAEHHGTPAASSEIEEIGWLSTAIATGSPPSTRSSSTSCTRWVSYGEAAASGLSFVVNGGASLRRL